MRLLDDVHRGDNDVLHRTVTRIGLNGGDRVDNGTGGLVGDGTEDRVLALKPLCGGGGDEELRAVGSLTQAATGVGHGQDVGSGEGQRGIDLIVEDITRATGAGAQWVTALNHEAGDDTMEDDIVVQGCMGLLAGARVSPCLLAGGQPREVGDGLRRLLGVELQADIAEVGVKSRFHE